MKFSPDQLRLLTTASGGGLAVASLGEAFAFCRRLARSHYENFPVGSLLIPARLQPHFFSVYAFSRLTDDIADELADTALQMQMLDDCEALLTAETLPMPGNPIFLALRDTMRRCAIPAEPFLRLLTAFRRDIHFAQPHDWDDVLSYCACSANPVGELVLRIFSMYTAVTAPYSDDICTGLQLANFWQDISVDRRRGRLYIPAQVLQRHGLTARDLLHEENSGNLPEKFAPCLEELLRYTTPMFDRGEHLLNYLTSGRLRLEIALTIEGGRCILRETRRQGGNIVHVRPTIHKAQYAALFLRAVRRII